MKNKVIITIEQTEIMKYTINYEIKGDIWKWLRRNDTNEGYRTYEIIKDNEEKTFLYESYVDKYLRRLRNLRNIEIIDKRKAII